MCPSEYASCVDNQADRDSQGRTCEEELTWAFENQPEDYSPGTPGMMGIFVCFSARQNCPAEASSCLDVPACGDAFHAMMAQWMAGGTVTPPDMSTMHPMVMPLLTCLDDSDDDTREDSCGECTDPAHNCHGCDAHEADCDTPCYTAADEAACQAAGDTWCPGAGRDRGCNCKSRRGILSFRSRSLKCRCGQFKR